MGVPPECGLIKPMLELDARQHIICHYFVKSKGLRLGVFADMARFLRRQDGW